MPRITLHSINIHVCQDIDLAIEDQDFFVLLGPNGAGKTTLLTVIAGLAPYRGSVRFDDAPIDHLPPEKRGVSYLPQNLVLFPHLTVAQNIGYGLRARKEPPERIRDKTSELLQLMRLEHLAERHPRGLSGGEKQRTALARALATDPKVLLLDEPLASLDLQSAKRLRREVRQIHDLTGITTVYVTHNLEEAEELGNRVAFLHAGTLQQVGSPTHVYFHPLSDEVSTFIGAPNILECHECRPLGNGVAAVNCGELSVFVPYEGEAIRKIAFLPGDVYLAKEKPPGPDINRFLGRVTSIAGVRSMVLVDVESGGNNLLAEMPASAFEELGIAEGDEVHLILKLRRIRTYES